MGGVLFIPSYRHRAKINIQGDLLVDGNKRTETLCHFSTPNTQLFLYQYAVYLRECDYFQRKKYPLVNYWKYKVLTMPKVCKAELLQEILRKDVNGALAEHRDFFEQLNNRKAERIYSYGFDFGDVDLPYIREIMKRLGNTGNICWYQNSFPLKKDPNALIRQQEKIRKCGFNGKFEKPFA